MLDGDNSALLQRPTITDNTMAPGDVWFLDFRRRAARHLIAFREPNAYIAGAVTAGESTLFLLSGSRRTRLFLYRGDKVVPLVEFRADEASMSPLLATPKRAHFLLSWGIVRATGAFEPWAALYVFDGRTLQRSNDYPSLFAADIDPDGRLVAFAYRAKAADRLVVAGLAR